jgi:hypothetical protein
MAGMNDKVDSIASLKVIPGTYPLRMMFGQVEITASPENNPPFSVDAVVREEDTLLVMGADRHVRDPGEPLMKIMTRMIETRPETPGSVLVKGGKPLSLLAVVHDLNRDPTWKEVWVEKALISLFRIIEDQGIGALGLPLLGTLHGRMKRDRFIVLLHHVLEKIHPVILKRIWVIVPPGTEARIFGPFNPGPGI